MCGLELQARRKALGLAQHELGDLLGGVRQATVARWEQGTNTIPAGVDVELSGVEALVEEAIMVMMESILEQCEGLGFDVETDDELAGLRVEFTPDWEGFDGWSRDLALVACGRLRAELADAGAQVSILPGLPGEAWVHVATIS